jgi:hypothetical protein
MMTRQPLQSAWATPHDLVPVRYIILDCCTLTYVDPEAIDMLHLLMTQYMRAGIIIMLANIPADTMRTLWLSNFFYHQSSQFIYFSVDDALGDIRRDIRLQHSTPGSNRLGETFIKFTGTIVRRRSLQQHATWTTV